jgi:hypothetical protein
MATIDFQKVDAAFAHLANDQQGQAQLADFAGALDRLKRAALPNLNEHEAQYVFSALLHQRVGVQSNIHATGAAKTVAGFAIKAAVD